MDKQNWISIDIDGNIPEETVKELCSRSYELVFSKFSRKLKNEITQIEK